MNTLPLSNRSNMIILQYLDVKQLCNDIPNDIKYRNKAIIDVLTFQISKLSNDVKKDPEVIYYYANSNNSIYDFFIEFFSDYIDIIVENQPIKNINKIVDMFQKELDLPKRIHWPTYKSHKKTLNNKFIGLVQFYKEEAELEDLFKILLIELDINRILKFIRKELDTATICKYF